MKFERKVTPTIMDGEVVRWREVVPEGMRGGEVSASRNGVMVSGPFGIMNSRQDADVLVELIREACIEADRLCRRDGLWSPKR